MFSWLPYKLTQRHHTSFMCLLLILMRMSNGVERRTVRPQSKTGEGGEAADCSSVDVLYFDIEKRIKILSFTITVPRLSES